MVLAKPVLPEEGTVKAEGQEATQEPNIYLEYISLKSNTKEATRLVRPSGCLLACVLAQQSKTIDRH
jgi:hypothetical protein